MEALQSRMSALAAKEQQLSRELEEQETLLQWQRCDLMSLVAQLPPGQLQEISKALGETLTSAAQAPLCVEPPEALRRYWRLSSWFSNFRPFIETMVLFIAHRCFSASLLSGSAGGVLT